MKFTVQLIDKDNLMKPLTIGIFDEDSEFRAIAAAKVRMKIMLGKMETNTYELKATREHDHRD